jgi:hypothetical protein
MLIYRPVTDAPLNRATVEHESAELALNALIAELTALRGEITSRISSQLTLILGAGTIVGAIVGIVVSQKGNVALLSIVPLVTSVLGFVHTDNTRFINYAAKYIRDALWPMIAELSGYGARLPSWERTVSRIVWNSDAKLRTQNRVVTPFAYGFFGVVPGACLIYLAAAQIDRLNGIGMTAFVLGGLLTIFYVAVAIAISRQFSWSLDELEGS